MGSRALLLVNLHSRQGKHLRVEAKGCLQGLGFDVVEESTEKPSQSSGAIHCHRNEVDLVIVGGGDGTLNAAAEALVETQLPLGILPLGTANDLARTLGIPNSVPEACRIIAQGQVRRIDLGWVNGKYFFNVAGLGLSAKITQQLTKTGKRRWGVFAYAIAALKVIGESRPFRAEILLQDESIRVKTLQIAVGNGRYYGGGMAVVHDATIFDHNLDLYSLEVNHWWETILLLPALREGRHTHWQGVRTLHGQEFRVYTRKPHPINTDGEITTYTPAHFRVIPEAMPVFVPSSAM
jgi:YegS/Rv2252/BmrU family lipid kinase